MTGVYSLDKLIYKIDTHSALVVMIGSNTHWALISIMLNKQMTMSQLMSLLQYSTLCEP